MWRYLTDMALKGNTILTLPFKHPSYKGLLVILHIFSSRNKRERKVRMQQLIA